jgi:DNA-directed RNA polymerase subunit RPC12/RpoP
MSPSEQFEREREALHNLVDASFVAMYQWRADHPQAGFDEITAQVISHRRRFVALWLQQLACQHGCGEVAEGLRCERCGQPLVYKGRSRRVVEHLEAEVELKRAYYYCPHCRGGIFPPRSPAEIG